MICSFDELDCQAQRLVVVRQLRAKLLDRGTKPPGRASLCQNATTSNNDKLGRWLPANAADRQANCGNRRSTKSQIIVAQHLKTTIRQLDNRLFRTNSVLLCCVMRSCRSSKLLYGLSRLSLMCFTPLLLLQALFFFVSVTTSAVFWPQDVCDKDHQHK